jgi:GNAT superfamily N-acetyltransferase
MEIPDMNLDIVNVSENELEDFSSILQEAALWMRNEGQEMWRMEQLTTHHVLKTYSLDELYLAYIDGFSAAAIVLQEEDKMFWPKERKNSLYIHKLSIRRKYAKTGLSVAMISWAKSHAMGRHKKFLRLDCAADRGKLCKFYEKQGFRKVNEKLMFEQYLTAFYELEIRLENMTDKQNI